MATVRARSRQDSSLACDAWQGRGMKVDWYTVDGKL